MCPTNESDYLNPYGLGLLSRCFWPTVFKRGGWRFWVKFAEKFGAVWPVGKLPRTATPEQRADLLDVLAKMISDGVAVIPDDGSAEFLQAGDKTGTSALFHDIIANANNAISTVWLGHAGAGEAVAGKLGNDQMATNVREDLREDDANLVMQTMQKVIDWTCEINWGSAEDSPKFILKEKEQIDTTQAERDDKLSTSMERSGLRLTSLYFQKTYGLEVEDIEAAPATPAPPAAPQNMPGGLQFADPANIYPDQAAIDALGPMVTPEMMKTQMEPILAPIIKGLAETGDAKAAMDKLAAAFPDMDADALEQMLTSLIFIAEIIGRLNAGN